MPAGKLSDAAGISTSSISDKSDIFADYLDCSVDYLLGRTDNPEINR